MASQAVNLIAQRGLRYLEVFIFPVSPVLPEIAATPSSHHQDALLVGYIKELLSFKLAFKTDGVQSQVAHIAEFIGEPLRGFAQHHVGCPATAANQDVLAIDLEHAFRSIQRQFGDFGCDLANAELRAGLIGEFAVHFKRQSQIVQVRRPHLRRPPQPRMAQVEVRILVRLEDHVFRLSRRQFDRLREVDVFDAAFQRPFDRVITAIFQQRGHRQVGGVICRRINLRKHSRMPQRDRPAVRQIHLAPQAHVLVGRGGIPVHERDRQAVLGWRPDLHCERIRSGLNGGSNVELVGPPCSSDIVRVSDLLSIEEDVGAVVDAAEVQPHGFPGVRGGQRKFLAVPPRNRVGAVGRHRDI